MKFEVGSKVRVLDTDQVTEVIEIIENEYDGNFYICDNRQDYNENELDWAK